MTLRTDLLPVVDELRALAGPSGFDVRTSRLTVRTRTWAGGRRGLGPVTNSDLVLAQSYKFRELTSKEVASSGGVFEMGDLRVGPITPTDVSGGGYTEAQLAPDGSTGTEIIYVVTGALAGEYARLELDKSKPFSWYLTLRRQRTTP
jgi:hypothetical protein